MNDQTKTSPPKWFFIASAVALLWNVLGVAAFFGQLFMDPASLPPAELEFYENTPIWATIAFAVAVFGGTLGCIGLLLRKSWAFIMLAVCLLGILVQMSYSFFVGNGIEVFGPQGLVLPFLTLAIGVALVWFARFSTTRGWILVA